MPKSTQAAAEVRGAQTPVLSQRTLNRTLLDRQKLLRRVAMPVSDLVEHLVGLQAQVPNNPYVALWSRLRDFDPVVLSNLMEDRQAVRLALLRATLHLVTASDALAIRPVMQQTMERWLMRASPFGRQLLGVDIDKLVATGRALMEETPLTYAKLRAALTQLWPDRDPAALTYGVHYTAPLVQIPPRGLWLKSGLPTTTTLESWLRQPQDGDTSPDALVLRYLAAFGPASPADAQTWSGIQAMREVFERLRPRLRIYRDENKRELFDLPEATITDPDDPAPVRFLPEYDNALLSHADRSRIVSEADRKRTSRLNGFSAAILIDGFGGGLWKIVRQKRSATMQVEIFKAVSPAQRLDLETEASALLEFMTPDATTRHLEILEPNAP